MTEPEELPENLAPTESGAAQKIAPAVMMDDSPDEATAADERASEVAQAYGVKPFFWRDIKLAPLSIDREGDWNMHRELIDAPALHEIIRKSAAMAPDALRVLWFLAHDPSEWLDMPGSKFVTDSEDGRWVRMTGKERALELEKKIRAWGAENVSGSEGVDMVSLFYDIYQSAHSTRATAKPSERKSDDRSKN